MPEIELGTLKGKPALVFVALAIVVAGMGYRSRAASFDTEGRAALQQHIVADYARAPLAQLEANMKQGTREDHLEAMARETMDLLNVEIVDFELRGSGDKIYVKAEIEVNGKTPPDGRRYRFFRAEHSWMSGWKIRNEVSESSFRLKF